MKNTLFALLMLASVVAYGQTKNYYCVQVLATENPHLLTPEHFAIVPFDTAMTEIAIIDNKVIYRIMFVYEDKNQQRAFFNMLKTDFPDALMLTRKEEQYKEMTPLFENLK